MYYPRKLQKELEKQISSKEIIVLTGMRRVGKTTLYQAIFDSIQSTNKVFLDIENPLDRRVFEELDYNNIVLNLRPFGITPDKKAYLFLDEIQAMPEITKAIKYLYDHYDIKFFVTGSSSFYLKNVFPESLMGRKFVFHLYPLDFEEFLTFKGIHVDFYKTFKDKSQSKNRIAYEKIQKMYDEYLRYGGFPQVVVEKDTAQKKRHLSDIVKSYFEKDVRSLSQFREINTFRDLLLLLMKRIGTRLDITRLSSELSISRETVYSYLAFLEGTFVIDLVTAYSKSPDRRVVKSKKIYFLDTGLVREFADVSEGSLFENAVYINAKKYAKNIYYYQKQSGKEIDFILDDKVALEVKLKGIPCDLKQLSHISKELLLKEWYVVTKQYSEEKDFIPALMV